MKDCEALSRIVLHYSIFILTVIKQTLWCQLITVYCTLTLKFVKRSMHRSQCLKELEQGHQWQNVTWKHNWKWYFCNYFSTILSWLAWKVCTSYLIYPKYNWIGMSSLDIRRFAKQLLFYMVDIGEEQLQKWKITFSMVNYARLLMFLFLSLLC